MFFDFILVLNLFYSIGCFFYIYVYLSDSSVTTEDQQKDPLKLNVQKAVSHPMDAGKRHGSQNGSKCLTTETTLQPSFSWFFLAHLQSSPYIYFWLSENQSKYMILLKWIKKNIFLDHIPSNHSFNWHFRIKHMWQKSSAKVKYQYGDIITKKLLHLC